MGTAFFLVYLGLGLTLHARAPRIFLRLDLAFDADVPSRIIELTRPPRPGPENPAPGPPIGDTHSRTHLHPLFVLLLNPPGLALRSLMRALGIERSARLAAILLTSLAAGGSVALFFTLLRRWVRGGLAAIIWATLFGFSSSQLVFGCLPETFPFSALSLLVVAVVVSDPGRSAAARLAASTACFGMAVTNLAAVFLVRAESAGRESWRAAVGPALRLSLATVVTAAILAGTVQRWIHPRTLPFYLGGGVAAADRGSFYHPASIREGLERAGDLAAHLLLFDLAAPRLLVQGDATWPTVDFPPLSWGALRAIGLAHALGWLGVVSLAVLGLARGPGPLPVPSRALLLWLALHALLHSVFGTSLFLYSGQWTFGVVALTGLGFDRWMGDSPTRRRVGLLALGVVLATQVWANAGLFHDLLAVFA